MLWIGAEGIICIGDEDEDEDDGSTVVVDVVAGPFPVATLMEEQKSKGFGGVDAAQNVKRFWSPWNWGLKA